MRRSDTEQLMTEIEQTWLAMAGVCHVFIRMIDGKPLAVSGVTKDKDAGYGRSARGIQKGYKLHAVWATGPLPSAWALAPPSTAVRRQWLDNSFPRFPGEVICLATPNMTPMRCTT